jgi:hypothetical protein
LGTGADSAPFGVSSFITDLFIVSPKKEGAASTQTPPRSFPNRIGFFPRSHPNRRSNRLRSSICTTSFREKISNLKVGAPKNPKKS